MGECKNLDQWQKNFSSKDLGEKGKEIARKKGWETPTSSLTDKARSQKGGPLTPKHSMITPFLCARHIPCQKANNHHLDLQWWDSASTVRAKATGLFTV